MTPVGLEYLKCLALIGSQQAWGWVASILLESFCLKEVGQLGLSLQFRDEEEEDKEDDPTSSKPLSTKLLPTREGKPPYSRALFLLYAIPHVIASLPLVNASEVALIATKLCHALEIVANSGATSKTKTSSAEDASLASSSTDTLAPSWEAQLVLVNVLVHLIFLEGVGKCLKAKKRIVDAIFRWMEAKSTTLQKYCPFKLKERLTKVLVLKKALS